jgi:peroxiredoxin
MTAAVGLALPGLAHAEEAKPLALGATAPSATVKMKSATDGKMVSIADVKGKKGTLVVFTCNHCPYAKAWEGRIVALANDYTKKGIGSILINANDPNVAKGDKYEDMQTRAKETGMQVPYAVDETSGIARAFGAEKTPEAYLFDTKGKLVYHGTIDDNDRDAGKVTKTYLKDALEAVLTGKTVPAPETKAMGCGIKFRKNS